jgi:hypothetical protein
MKFAVGLGIAFVALAAEVFFVATLILEPALPPDGRVAIDEYVRFERSLGVDMTVTRIVHATKPWLFTAAASAETFGDSPYYCTRRSYSPALATTEPGPPGSIPVARSSSRRDCAARAVPYPPKEVWCVALRSDEQPPKLIFAALHFDLYNADWIVHEPAASPGTAALASTLREIGCDLKLD